MPKVPARHVIDIFGWKTHFPVNLLALLQISSSFSSFLYHVFVLASSSFPFAHLSVFFGVSFGLKQNKSLEN